MLGRVYYGWFIVGAGLLSLLFSAGGTYYSFGVFMVALMGEFGWSRGAVSGGLSAWWLASALAMPLVGRLLDVYGARKVMALGALLAGLTMGLLSRTNSLGQLYLLYGLLGFCGASLGLVSVGSLVARWFSRRRGMATGIAVSGIGLGGLLVVPLTGLLVAAWGWRQAYLFLGALVWLVLLPVVLAVVRPHPPAQEAEAPEEVEAPLERPWTLRRAVSTTSFWLVTLSLFLGHLGLFGVLTHQVPFATDLGLPVPRAALLLAFTAGMGVVGKVTFGALADRLGPPRGTALSLLLQALAVVILLGTRDPVWLWAFVVLFGFSMGGLAALVPVLASHFFGLSAVGSILGAILPATAVAAALGPLVAGRVYDLAGSYQGAFVTFIVGYGVAAAAILLARRPSLGYNSAARGAPPGGCWSSLP